MNQSIQKFIPQWVISAYHWCLAVLATFVYYFPSEKIKVIGVTGTDGKTTTVNLVSKLLEFAGHKTGLTSTINFKIGSHKWVNKTKQGMQGRFKTQSLISRMVKAGCDYAVIETTSEGMKQYRHIGINYDLAVFTNLSEDHIESHGSFEKYREAKMRLFEKVAKSCKVDTDKFFVANGDDPNVKYFLEIGCKKKIIFGIRGKGDGLKSFGLPYLEASNLKLTLKGTEFDMLYYGDIHEGIPRNPEGGEAQTIHVKTNLIGEFNVYNVLCAMTVCLTQGVDLETMRKALLKIKGIPGRMEFIDCGQPFSVIVDYAHAPNALENVYQTLKPYIKGRLISILGSQGGGRDKQKRPILGRLAGKYADVVIVTNEDPYDDDPEEIIDEVLNGALTEGKIIEKDTFRFSSRRDAIKFAVKQARPGDAIVITGKGAERTMAVAGGKYIKWDDREVAREILEKFS